MRGRQHNPWLGFAFALAVCAPLAFSIACTKDEPFLEYIVECEEAVARLDECCPGFDAAQLECTFRNENKEGCGGHVARVAFSQEESECILDTSCEDLVAKRICEAAQAAHGPPDAGVSRAPGNEGVTFRPAVCR